MKTWAFIGSDKNAGKTTVLNFVHNRLRETSSDPVCLTSIGINGEEIDSYENLPKPRIPIFRGDWFVTAAEHLSDFAGSYEAQSHFAPPGFRKKYVLGHCCSDFLPVLEGPNDKRELLRMKENLAPLFPRGYLLIDGSVDRQFLGHPWISDGICFALLISSRKEQQRKAADLLIALSIPECREEEKEIIARNRTEKTKSLLFGAGGKILYRGESIPFLDQALKKNCLKRRKGATRLYLNGAMTRTLHALLASQEHLRIILDNFTLYQNVSVQVSPAHSFKPELALLQPVLVRHIFLKQESNVSLTLPAGIPVHDLFRDEMDDYDLRMDER
jgi:hypothetical protein